MSIITADLLLDDVQEALDAYQSAKEKRESIEKLKENMIKVRYVLIEFLNELFKTYHNPDRPDNDMSKAQVIAKRMRWTFDRVKKFLSIYDEIDEELKKLGHYNPNTHDVKKSTFYNRSRRPRRPYPHLIWFYGPEVEDDDWEFVDESELAEEVWYRVTLGDYIGADSEEEDRKNLDR